MKNGRIRKCFMALSLFGIDVALSSCSNLFGHNASQSASPNRTRTVSIVGSDGIGKEYTVEIGKTFDYQIENNNLLFVGCYDEKDGQGDKYVTYDGKSVVWKDKMPDTLYAYYVSTNNLAFSAKPINKKNSLSNSGTGASATGNFVFEDAYVNYRKKNDLKAITTISIDHYDTPSVIYDNWSNLSISCNDKDIYKNSLRATVDWTPFSETFELSSKNLAQGLSITLEHPLANASGNDSTIKNIRADVHLYTEEQLDDLLTFKNLGKHFEQYFPDGSQTLRAVTRSVDTGTTIPYYVKKLIEKYDQSSLSVTFTISSYGGKTLFFSNWGDSNCKLLDDKENEIVAKSVHLENNSGYGLDNCKFDLTKEQTKRLVKAAAQLQYSQANASQQPYYTKFVKVEYDFNGIDENNSGTLTRTAQKQTI